MSAGGHGTPERPINDSKGCGGVMRVAPIGWLTGQGSAQVFDLAAVFAWQPVSLFWLKGGAPLALTGVCVYVWFGAEVMDLLRSRNERPVGSPEVVERRPASGSV